MLRYASRRLGTVARAALPAVARVAAPLPMHRPNTPPTWWPAAPAGDVRPQLASASLPPLAEDAPVEIVMPGGLIGLALELPPVDAEGTGETIQAKSKKGWRTYQPSLIKRKRTHGFLKRLSTTAGKKVLKRRIQKGRWKIAVT